jgi:hypothetical protein
MAVLATQTLLYALNQRSQTRGPPDAFVRSASISKTDEIISFDQI